MGIFVDGQGQKGLQEGHFDRRFFRTTKGNQGQQARQQQLDVDTYILEAAAHMLSMFGRQEKDMIK